MIKTVTVQELCEQLESDENSVLIDVRCPDDFKQGHIPRACNIPLGSMPLPQLMAEWGREAEGRPIYFICQTGTRAQRLVDDLGQLGFFGAQCVAGGMVAWQTLGLPLVGEFSTEEVESAASDRLGRLIFGFMVMSGCILGLAVHRGFFVLPVLAAAEAIFSGITGWSGITGLWGGRDRR